MRYSSAATHIRQRRDFDDATFHVLLDFLRWKHVVQRVVQRSQIRHDLFVKVAWQKSQRFTRLDRRPRQNNPRDFFLPQRRQRRRHGQIRLPRSCRPDPKCHIMRPDRIQIFFLPNGFRESRSAFFSRSLDTIAHNILERGDALMLYDIKRVGKFPVSNRRARLERTFQR